MIEEPKLDDLYREVILDHYRHPRNRGKLEQPTVSWEGKNPLCGDEVEITVKLEGDRVGDIKLVSKGCSISQASASMMSEAIKGRTLEEVAQYTELFKRVMVQGASANGFPESMEELRALEGVKQYPVRIKCALLPWETLTLGLERRK